MASSAAQREQNLASIKSTLMPPSPSPSTEDRIPIIDAHIHLYPASETHTLAWLPSNDAAHPLAGQHSLDEYCAATRSPPELEGFIFIETDRVHSLDAATNEIGTDGDKHPGWAGPLMEVSWISRVALGTPRAGEGHDASQAKLCLAIVPWAPVPLGEAAMEVYFQRVADQAGDSLGRIRGFRYLVQDKPPGTMLGDDFIASLKWMGRKGLVFDVGVDQHRQGDWVLAEALKMIERAHDGVKEEDKVVFVLNHLCKPDLTTSPSTSPASSDSFSTWRSSLFQLSRCSKTYMKLSGCFSEMDSEVARTASPEAIFAVLEPWLAVLLATFGPYRLMFGSDWPVCTLGGGRDEAWCKWRDVVQRMCRLASLDRNAQVMVWSGTAVLAYGIEELM